MFCFPRRDVILFLFPIGGRVNAEQRQLLQDSWQTIAADGDRLATLFYDRLFELDPSIQPLFAKTDMAALRGKFLQMLGDMLRVIDNPDALFPEAVGLARRHVGYGVVSSHYESVGQALVWMLEEGLGDTFSGDVRRAWSDAYRFISVLMQRTTDATTSTRA